MSYLLPTLLSGLLRSSRVIPLRSFPLTSGGHEVEEGLRDERLTTRVDERRWGAVRKGMIDDGTAETEDMSDRHEWGETGMVTARKPAHLPRSCRSPLFGSVPVTRSRGSLDVRRERRGREKGNREARGERNERSVVGSLSFRLCSHPTLFPHSFHSSRTSVAREVRAATKGAWGTDWAEREKSGDRDERKEERSRPSLTPLVPISSPPIPSVPRLPCHLVTTGDRMRWGRVEWAKHRGANERRAEWLRNGSNRSVRSSHLRYRLATFIPHPRYALSPSRFAFRRLRLARMVMNGERRWQGCGLDYEAVSPVLSALLSLRSRSATPSVPLHGPCGAKSIERNRRNRERNPRDTNRKIIIFNNVKWMGFLNIEKIKENNKNKKIITKNPNNNNHK